MRWKALRRESRAVLWRGFLVLRSPGLRRDKCLNSCTCTSKLVRLFQKSDKIKRIPETFQAFTACYCLAGRQDLEGGGQLEG